MKKLTKNAKQLSFLLVAGLLLFSAVLPVEAFIQKNGTVNETVIMRQNPDKASGQIKELSGGQSVVVNNQLEGSDGATWYQILMENGTVLGYVPANTITISSGSSATNGSTSTGTTNNESTGTDTTTTMQTVTKTKKVGKVTANNAIRMREQATTSSEQIASMLPNDTFDVLSEVTAADGYVWYEAEFDDKGTLKKGYVRSDLVKVEEMTYEEQIPADIPASTTPSNPADTDAPYSITSQVNEEGTTVWYLMNNQTGEAKEITSLLTTQQAKAGSGVYKVIVVVLLILLILAAAAATFFYMRWQDAEEFIMELREKQARAKRQSVPPARPTPAKQPVTKQAPQAQPSRSVNKPTSQPTSQAVNRPLPQSDGYETNRPIGQPVNRPMSRPLGQSTGQPINRPISQPTDQPISRPISQPTGQSINRPISRPTAQPISKPIENPTEMDFILNTSDIVAATKQELQNNRTSTAKNPQAGGWKSKNFLTDDDDLDFDFLDMDDK